MKKTKMFDAMAKIDDRYVDRCLAQKGPAAESGGRGSDDRKKMSSKRLAIVITSVALIAVLTLSVILILHFSNKPIDPVPEEPGAESQAAPDSGNENGKEPSLAGEDKSSEADGNPGGTDMTVQIESFDRSAYPNTIETYGSTDFAVVYSSLSDLYAASETVVYGTVEAVSYWDLNGSANTVYTFRVEETIKGDIPERAAVSVITAGGYCRLRSFVNAFGKGKYESYSEQEIDETVLHHSFAGVTEEPATGDRYVLFLSSPTNGEEPFPDGLYCETGSFMGRFIEQNDGQFARVLPQNEPGFYGTEKTAYSKAEIVSENE